jgi:hypothetical protein
MIDSKMLMLINREDVLIKRVSDKACWAMILNRASESDNFLRHSCDSDSHCSVSDCFMLFRRIDLSVRNLLDFVLIDWIERWYCHSNERNPTSRKRTRLTNRRLSEAEASTHSAVFRLMMCENNLIFMNWRAESRTDQNVDWTVHDYADNKHEIDLLTADDDLIHDKNLRSGYFKFLMGRQCCDSW